MPPSRSGIADYVAEQLPRLAEATALQVVVEDVEAVDPGLRAGFDVRSPREAQGADLDLYHVGNSPAHGYVYRAARLRPGALVLHDLSLHALVLSETVERGDRAAYLREMRRAYGEVGSFAGRQVARALGGPLLPARFPLSEHLIEESLGVVALTRAAWTHARRHLPAGRPALRLPHHLSLPPDPLPARDAARRALGLPPEALIVTAPGFATSAKRLDLALAALGRLRERHPSARLVVAGECEAGLPLTEWAAAAGMSERLLVTGRLPLDAFVHHLCAADVVLALRFPSHGEMSGALLRALGVGRPVVVSAGSAAADELPEGVIVSVPSGRAELEHLVALLDVLLGDATLRQTIGRLAAEHVRRRHDLGASVAQLVAFLRDLAGRAEALRDEVEQARAPEGSRFAYLRDELRWAARDLGLPQGLLHVEPLLRELSGERA